MDDDDDLDELLDEVEKKFCSNVSVASPARVPSREAEKCGKDNVGQRKHSATKPEQPISSVTEDIDALLEELLEEDFSDSPALKTEQFPRGTAVEKKLSSQSGGRKCCPVFVGGSSVINGVGTATSKRSCDQLRCTSCDFRVLLFDDCEWDSSCDYLFLRNNMPDHHKLRAKLKKRRGLRAYACQCSWFSASEPADLRDQPQLTYKDLYVYQLECPTQAIEWTSGKTVCVAGYSSSKNEILELHLPPKLFAAENKGLCAQRDFKVVHGGFTDGPVRCLRHVPGTRCVVTNDGLSSDLQVWDLGGDDSDVIRRTGSVAGTRGVSAPGSRIAARFSSQPRVLHGAESGDVRLTQLTSGQPLYKLETDSADPLSSLHFVSDAIFLACCCNGNVYIADTRTSAAPQLSPPPASSGDSALWWADASTGPPCLDPSGCRIVRLSSSGQTVISDLRNPGGAVSRAQLDVQSRRCNVDDVRVSWAPALDDCIAVSGFSGAVQIYDTSAWRAELQDAQPLFEHRGHAVSSRSDDGAPIFITSHVWHPERPRTLLSAASDGSVHVWDWVDQSAGGR